MKKFIAFKKLLAVTVSAVMLALLPNANALTVSAEEPATFIFTYDGSGNDDGWWYQQGSEWDDEAGSTSIHFLHGDIKDGDIVVVRNAAPSLLTINVHLSNLTIHNDPGNLIMVSVTGGIDNCYILNDAQASVSGDVLNAYVYGAAVANFHNNVTNLHTYNDNPDAGANIGVNGTVAYFDSKDENYGITPSGTNFAANTFSLENGTLLTDPSQYTQDISGGPVSGTVSGTASNTQAAPQSTPKPSASDEYDAVPKTGESSPAMWLSLLAVSCLSISLILRRTSKQ